MAKERAWLAKMTQTIRQHWRKEMNRRDSTWRTSSFIFRLMTKKFHVTLLEHDEGVSVSCQELPGCHSQGATIAEAMENIHDAIEGCLELYGEPEVRCQIREMEVVTG